MGSSEYISDEEGHMFNPTETQTTCYKGNSESSFSSIKEAAKTIDVSQCHDIRVKGDFTIYFPSKLWKHKKNIGKFSFTYNTMFFEDNPVICLGKDQLEKVSKETEDTKNWKDFNFWV